jgi:HEAT repeat protein
MASVRATILLRSLLLATLLGAAVPAGAAAEQKFEDAQRLLGNASWKDRIQGLEILDGLKGDARAEALALKALDDYDWGVVIRAAATLGRIGGEASRDRLVKLSVEGEIAWIRRAASAALRSVDAAGGQARLLGAARTVKEPLVMARALEAVGVQGTPGAVKTLIGLASHREADVAAEAVRALGRIAAASPEARDEAVDVLRRVLGLRSERKHFFAYAAAIEGLGLVVSQATTDILVLEAVRWIDDDAYVPERIARGLAAPGRTGVADSFRAAISKEKSPLVLKRVARLAARLGLKDLAPEVQRMLAEPDERVRSEAVRALGLLGAADATAAIRAALADKSSYVRREAVTALCRLLPAEEFRALGTALLADREPEVRIQFVVEILDAKDPAGMPALEPFFEDRAWRVASAAVAAFGALGAAKDLPAVLPILPHKDWRIRGAAFEAAGRLRAKEAVPYLIEGLRDRDPVVKGVCHANLQILTSQKLAAQPDAWEAWWSKNGSGLNIVKRSRRSESEIIKEAGEKDRYGESMYGRRGVEILQKARILVVLGRWDHAEKVLDHLRIPHTALRAQELKDAGLNPNQIILVNCEGTLDKDSAERIQWFVNVGGYLMSTDWALANAVRVAFPGYSGHFPGANTGNDVVVVEEATRGHPFTAGVFTDVPAMKWWLEIQAFPITVDYPERIDILVDSAEMRRRYGSSPLALAFRWGLGKVQHSVSHFALQEEGMTQARGEAARKVFAADHLGLSLEAIRELDKEGAFAGALNEETLRKIAPDYSMFRLIVNVVAEKSKWVEDL